MLFNKFDNISFKSCRIDSSLVVAFDKHDESWSDKRVGLKVCSTLLTHSTDTVLSENAIRALNLSVSSKMVSSAIDVTLLISVKKA